MQDPRLTQRQTLTTPHRGAQTGFTNTEPAVEIGPFPQWSDKKKIVAMDPWGHLAPFLFKDIIEKENGKLAEPFFNRHMPC